MKLLKHTKKHCLFLSGIHLNNNNIIHSNYFTQVLDIFYLKSSDVVINHPPYKFNSKSNQSHNSHQQNIDYEKYLRPYYSVSAPQNSNNDEDNKGSLLKKHKDHIVVGKEMKILE